MIAWWWLGLAMAAEPISLDAAWEAARVAPDAVLARVETDLGRAERLEAGAWTNPTLDYQGYGRVRGTADAINGQQHQVDVGIPLPITGELAARLQRGRVAVELGAARAATRYALLGEAVGRAWLELLTTQEREHILDEASRRVVRLVELTELRAAEGAARPWDVDRMRLALVALDRRLALARQDRQVAAGDLAALLGRAGEALEAVGSLDAPLPLEPRADAVSPFVAEARWTVDHREISALEARRSRVPEPQLRVGGYWTTDGDSSSVVAGVGWDLPVFDRGQGRVAMADAERAAAQAESRRAEAWVGSQRRALSAAREDLMGLAGATRVPSGAVLAAAEVAWTEGEASILELVDAVGAEVDQRLDAVDIQLALRQLELRLATLGGSVASKVTPR